MSSSETIQGYPEINVTTNNNINAQTNATSSQQTTQLLAQDDGTEPAIPAHCTMNTAANNDNVGIIFPQNDDPNTRPNTTPSLQKHGDITVLTWNILASCYLFPHRLDYLPSSYNDFVSSRLPRFLNVIKNADADVLCLQEVDQIEHIVDGLLDLGYDIVYRQRGTYIQKSINVAGIGKDGKKAQNDDIDELNELNELNDDNNNNNNNNNDTNEVLPEKPSQQDPTDVSEGDGSGLDTPNMAQKVHQKKPDEKRPRNPKKLKNKHNLVQFNNTSLYTPCDDRKELYAEYTNYLQHNHIDSTVLLGHIMSQVAQTHGNKIQHFLPFDAFKVNTDQSEKCIEITESTEDESTGGNLTERNLVVFQGQNGSTGNENMTLKSKEMEKKSQAKNQKFEVFRNADDAFNARLEDTVDFSLLFESLEFPQRVETVSDGSTTTIIEDDDDNIENNHDQNDNNNNNTNNTNNDDDENGVNSKPILTPFPLAQSPTITANEIANYRCNPLISGIIQHRPKQDGLLIAWKSNKFQLSLLPLEIDLNILGYTPVYDAPSNPNDFGDNSAFKSQSLALSLALDDKKLKRKFKDILNHKSITNLSHVVVNARLLRDNIAIMAALNPIKINSNGQSIVDKNKTILIGNSYFFFSPLYEDVKIVQALFTTRILDGFRVYLEKRYQSLLDIDTNNCIDNKNEKNNNGQIMTLFCGDFNSTPSSAALRVICGDTLDAINSIDDSHPDHDQLLLTSQKNFQMTPEEVQKQKTDRLKKMKEKQTLLLEQLKNGGDNTTNTADTDNNGLDESDEVILNTTIFTSQLAPLPSDINSSGLPMKSTVLTIDATKEIETNSFDSKTGNNLDINIQNEIQIEPNQLIDSKNNSYGDGNSQIMVEQVIIPTVGRDQEISNMKLDLRLALERTKYVLRLQLEHDNFIRSIVLNNLNTKIKSTVRSYHTYHNYQTNQKKQIDNETNQPETNVIFPLSWEYYLRYPEFANKPLTTMCTLNCPNHSTKNALVDSTIDNNDSSLNDSSLNKTLPLPCTLPMPPLMLVGDMIALVRTLRGLGVDTMQTLIQPSAGFFPMAVPSLQPYIDELKNAQNCDQVDNSPNSGDKGDRIAKIPPPLHGNAHFKISETSADQARNAYQQIITYSFYTKRIVVTASTSLLIYWQSLMVSTKGMKLFTEDNPYLAPSSIRHTLQPSELPLFIYLPPVQMSYFSEKDNDSYYLTQLSALKDFFQNNYYQNNTDRTITLSHNPVPSLPSSIPLVPDSFAKRHNITIDHRGKFRVNQAGVQTGQHIPLTTTPALKTSESDTHGVVIPNKIEPTSSECGFDDDNDDDDDGDDDDEKKKKQINHNNQNNQDSCHFLDLFSPEVNKKPIKSLYVRLLSIHTATTAVHEDVKPTKVTGVLVQRHPHLTNTGKKVNLDPDYIDLPKPQRHNIRLCSLIGILQAGLSIETMLARCTHCNTIVPENRRGCAQNDHCGNLHNYKGLDNITRNCEVLRCVNCVEYFVGKYSTIFPNFVFSNYFGAQHQKLNHNFVQNIFKLWKFQQFQKQYYNNVEQTIPTISQLLLSQTNPIFGPRSNNDINNLNTLESYVRGTSAPFQTKKFKSLLFEQFPTVNNIYKINQNKNQIDNIFEKFSFQVTPKDIDLWYLGKYSQQAQVLYEYNFDVPITLHNIDTDLFIPQILPTEHNSIDASEQLTTPNGTDIPIESTSPTPLHYNSSQLALFIQAIKTPTPYNSPQISPFEITSISIRSVMLHWLVGSLGPSAMFVSHIDFLSRYLRSNSLCIAYSIDVDSSMKTFNDLECEFDEFGLISSEDKVKYFEQFNQKGREDIDYTEEFENILKHDKNQRSYMNNDGELCPLPLVSPNPSYQSMATSCYTTDSSDSGFLRLQPQAAILQLSVTSEDDINAQLTDEQKKVRLQKKKDWKQERRKNVENYHILNNSKPVPPHPSTIGRNNSNEHNKTYYIQKQFHDTAEDDEYIRKTNKKAYSHSKRLPVDSPDDENDRNNINDDDDGDGHGDGDDDDNQGDDDDIDDLDIYSLAPPLPGPPSETKLYVFDGLYKLAKTLRSIGLDTAYGFPPEVSKAPMSQKIQAVFDICRLEERILITNSRTILQRRDCPPYILLPNVLPEGLTVQNVQKIEMPSLNEGGEVSYKKSQSGLDEHGQHSDQLGGDHNCTHTTAPTVLESASLAKIQASTTIDPNVIWGYKHGTKGNKGYVRFDQPTTAKVEHFYQYFLQTGCNLEQSTVWINPTPNRVYQLDFIKMTQRNSKTDYVRPILRLDPNIVNNQNSEQSEYSHQVQYGNEDTRVATPNTNNLLDNAIKTQTNVIYNPDNSILVCQSDGTKIIIHDSVLSSASQTINLSDYYLYLIKTRLNFKFSPSSMYIRCTLCNGTFKSLSIYDIRQMTFLPSSVKTGRNKKDKKKLDFYKCNTCNQVYWWGAKSVSVQDRLTSFLHGDATLVIIPPRSKVEQQPSLDSTLSLNSLESTASYNNQINMNTPPGKNCSPFQHDDIDGTTIIDDSDIIIPLTNSKSPTQSNNSSQNSNSHVQVGNNSSQTAGKKTKEKQSLPDNNIGQNLREKYLDGYWDVIQRSGRPSTVVFMPNTPPDAPKEIIQIKTHNNNNSNVLYTKRIVKAQVKPLKAIEVLYQGGSISTSLQHPLLFGLFVNSWCVIADSNSNLKGKYDEENPEHRHHRPEHRHYHPPDHNKYRTFFTLSKLLKTVTASYQDMISVKVFSRSDLSFTSAFAFNRADLQNLLAPLTPYQNEQNDSDKYNWTNNNPAHSDPLSMLNKKYQHSLTNPVFTNAVKGYQGCLDYILVANPSKNGTPSAITPQYLPYKFKWVITLTSCGNGAIHNQVNGVENLCPCVGNVRFSVSHLFQQQIAQNKVSNPKSNNLDNMDNIAAACVKITSPQPFEGIETQSNSQFICPEVVTCCDRLTQYNQQNLSIMTNPSDNSDGVDRMRFEIENDLERAQNKQGNMPSAIFENNNHAESNDDFSKSATNLQQPQLTHGLSLSVPGTPADINDITREQSQNWSLFQTPTPNGASIDQNESKIDNNGDNNSNSNNNNNNNNNQGNNTAQTPATPSKLELVPTLIMGHSESIICPHSMEFFFKGFEDYDQNCQNIWQVLKQNSQHLLQQTPFFSQTHHIQDQIHICSHDNNNVDIAGLTHPPFPNKLNPSDHIPIVASFDFGH